MKERINILYLHGMGGGADSRIPSILNDLLSKSEYAGKVKVVAKTYSFDPVVARNQIYRARKTYRPVFVIGESLGAVHAIGMRGIRHILISPALGAPRRLAKMAWISRIPLLNRIPYMIFKQKEGNRQHMRFEYEIMKRYAAEYERNIVKAKAMVATDDPLESFYAYFGTNDSYYKHDVVNVQAWEDVFGKDTYEVYDGSHFMEEEYINTLLFPRILDMLEEYTAKQKKMFIQSITPEEIDKLKPLAFSGRITVIDKVDDSYYEAIAYLKKQRVIGFDTETRPVFNPGEHTNGTALLQLSGGDRAFLFRLKQLGLPVELAVILSSKNILKIGAAVNDDIRGLQKYKKFRAASFVDLQSIVCEWGIKDKSVKKMAAIIMEGHISKKEQCSNWEATKLSKSQLKYAATDAWICRQMYLKLLDIEKCPLAPEDINPQHEHKDNDPCQKKKSGKKVKKNVKKDIPQEG